MKNFPCVLLQSNFDGQIDVFMRPHGLFKKIIRLINMKGPLECRCSVNGEKRKLLRYFETSIPFSLELRCNGKSFKTIVKTYSEIVVNDDFDVKVVRSADLVVMSEKERTYRKAMITIMENSNHYQILQSSPQSTMEELEKAKRALLKMHHPDKHNNSLESNFITQKINESFDFLNDKERRDMYDRLLAHNDTIFMKKLWNKKRYIGLAIAGVGLAVGIGTVVVFSGGLVLIPTWGIIVGGAVGAGLIASAFGCINYIRSKDVSVYGVNWRHYAKTIAIYGGVGVAAGAAAGFAAIGIGMAAGSLPAAASGAIFGTVDGTLVSIGTTIADIVVNKKYKDMTFSECVIYVSKSAAWGLILGAATGAALGAISSGTTASSGIDNAVGDVSGASANITRSGIHTGGRFIRRKFLIIQTHGRGFLMRLTSPSATSDITFNYNIYITQRHGPVFTKSLAIGKHSDPVCLKLKASNHSCLRKVVKPTTYVTPQKPSIIKALDAAKEPLKQLKRGYKFSDKNARHLRKIKADRKNNLQNEVECEDIDDNGIDNDIHSDSSGNGSNTNEGNRCSYSNDNESDDIEAIGNFDKSNIQKSLIRPFPLNDCQENILHNFLLFKNEAFPYVYAKMVVSYKLDGFCYKFDVKKDVVLNLPNDATDIIVHFVAYRFIATRTNVMGWDRRLETWLNRQAVFEFSTPPSRTFVLKGSLYFEKIAIVRDGEERVIYD